MSGFVDWRAFTLKADEPGVDLPEHYAPHSLRVVHNGIMLRPDEWTVAGRRLALHDPLWPWESGDVLEVRGNAQVPRFREAS